MSSLENYRTGTAGAVNLLQRHLRQLVIVKVCLLKAMKLHAVVLCVTANKHRRFGETFCPLRKCARHFNFQPTKARLQRGIKFFPNVSFHPIHRWHHTKMKKINPVALQPYRALADKTAAAGQRS